MTTRQATQFWKFGGGLLGLIALLAILIAGNVVLGNFRVRTDLTQDRIYTLSDGTLAILNKLDSPLTIKLFFTSDSPEIPPPLKHFGREVEDLLREYEIAAKGNIVLEKYDPRPDSDAEEWAERYGLIGQRMDMMGPNLYLGLVGVKGNIYETIPFLDPRKEQLMEYDITRMIARAAITRKPALGIMSSLPVMGVSTMPFAMPGEPGPGNQPAWIAFQELSQDYDVRQISSDTTAIDADIDVLIIVHPKEFSPGTFHAIDQFILRGGSLLAFVDPLCLADANLSRQGKAISMSRPSSDLGPLTSAWGVTYDPNKVLADLAASTLITQGNNREDDSPVFLSLRPSNINETNTITTQLESLIMACAGTFFCADSADLSTDRLLVSSAQSQLINSMFAQMGAESIRRDFKSGNERHALALRLHGRFKTAFPDGKPTSDADLKKDDNDKQANTSENETPADDTDSLKESIKPGTVIIVGDVDMLYDQFAVQELIFFGQPVYQPINDNINFLANAVDQLAGGSDLAAIRSRGRFDRPFHRVIALQREAQERWLMQEKALQEELESTRERLEALQSKKDKSQRFILSPEQQEELERFRQEEMKTQQELKRVRKNLREGIERLGVRVKVINILLMPAIVCLTGVSFGLYRQYRTRGAEDAKMLEKAKP